MRIVLREGGGEVGVMGVGGNGDCNWLVKHKEISCITSTYNVLNFMIFY